MNLSTAIAHTQIEQANSPTITVLTIQCACRNKVKIDRSVGARSAGFMVRPFGSAAIRDTATGPPKTPNRTSPDPAGLPDVYVKSLNRCRRLRIPREPSPVLNGYADDRTGHNAASVVNNRLPQLQQCCDAA